MRNQPSGPTGRHFLQIPGPTNVPDRVLQAIAAPTIDHRGPEFAELGKEIVGGMKRVLQTAGTVVVYPSSGTGAWEAALVNTLSPGGSGSSVSVGSSSSSSDGARSSSAAGSDCVIYRNDTGR